jgi:NitT/TauT family transport system substrate-binding protein
MIRLGLLGGTAMLGQMMAPQRACARLLFVIVALASVIGSPTESSALDKLHWQLGWLPTGEYAAFTAAVAKGIYQEEGIELTYSRGFGSGDTVKKVAAGAAPIGDGDISAVMAGRVRENLPMKAIMSIYTISPHAIFVLESSGIKTFKDLEGKKVATTPGNSHSLFFPLVARRNGVNPDKVGWTTVDPTAMAPMLIAGKVDGAVFYETHHYYINKQAEREGKKIVPLRFSDYGFKINSWVIFATEQTLKEKPDLMRRFLRASQKAIQWANTNREEVAKLHNQRHPEVAADDALGSLRTMLSYTINDDAKRVGFGRFDKEQLANTYKVVADAQKLDPAVDPQSFVDTSLLP